MAPINVFFPVLCAIPRIVAAHTCCRRSIVEDEEVFGITLYTREASRHCVRKVRCNGEGRKKFVEREQPNNSMKRGRVHSCDLYVDTTRIRRF